MKHPTKTTLILLALFLISQYIGLFIVNAYIDPIASQETGTTQFKEVPVGERPQIQEETSYFPIVIAILIGTALMMGIIKLGAMKLFKTWFFLALVITLTTSLAAVGTIDNIAAFTIAAALAIWRIFRNNPIIHNATEPLVYAGIAAIFVPVLNLLSISILLILIAIYDAWAVWQSKHMVTLAKAQTKAGLFTGLSIPNTSTQENQQKTKTSSKKKSRSTSKKITKTTRKSAPKKIIKQKTTNTTSSAILGGGDIAFPLLFAGVLLKDFSLTAALIAPVFALAALAFLFYKSKPGKFYPAMPFISTGCFVALGFLWLIGLV